MKTIIICMSMLLIGLKSFSQDSEPTKHQFDIFSNSNYLIDADDNNFQQKRIQTGSIWTSDYRMNDVMDFNAHMAYYDYPMNYLLPEHFANNTEMIFQIPGISWHYFPTPLDNISILYEPTLYIDQPGKFKTREGDATKPVFGFRTVGASILNGETRLLLRVSDFTTLPATVLSEPWPDKDSEGGIKRHNGNNTNDDDITYINFYGLTPTFENKEKNGAEFYLSINLRRLELDDNEQNNEVVLRITLPFESPNSPTSGNIKFSRIPSTIVNDYFTIVTSLEQNRGICQNITGEQNPNNLPSTIEITKNMLPLNSTNITISAFFRCYPFNNFETNPENLTKLGINVEYVGNCDIGIDWIKIETPDSRRLFHGFYDSYIATGMQQALAHYTDGDYTYPPKNLRFFRVYLRDEVGMQEWGVTRYFNKFVGNIGVSQTGSDYSKFFTYYTESPQIWTEEGAANRQSTCPYVRMANELNFETMNLKNGFNYPKEAETPGHSADSLNSSWELFPYKSG